MRKSQKQTTLKHLEEHGSITPVDAIYNYGIMRLGARIFELREDGYPIISEMTRGTNRDGDPVHYTTYILQKEGPR